jgi:peptide-methionine (S)-S-oxide reductase
VTYDPDELDYRDLLSVFFAIPTTTAARRRGHQYRSAIFYHSPEQKAGAEEVIARLGKEIFADRS